MSRQSKNTRKLALAKQITELHKKGETMGKSTRSHGKKWTYRSNPEIAKRIAEMNGTSREGRTSLKKVLEGAGTAAS
jgi:hypothetical protein